MWGMALFSLQCISKRLELDYTFFSSLFYLHRVEAQASLEGGGPEGPDCQVELDVAEPEARMERVPASILGCVPSAEWHFDIFGKYWTLCVAVRVFPPAEDVAYVLLWWREDLLWRMMSLIGLSCVLFSVKQVITIETPFQVKEEEENAMHNTVVIFSSNDNFTLKQVIKFWLLLMCEILSPYCSFYLIFLLTWPIIKSG